jgi:hypothetical protein
MKSRRTSAASAAASTARTTRAARRPAPALTRMVAEPRASRARAKRSDTTADQPAELGAHTETTCAHVWAGDASRRLAGEQTATGAAPTARHSDRRAAAGPHGLTPASRRNRDASGWRRLVTRGLAAALAHLLLAQLAGAHLSPTNSRGSLAARSLTGELRNPSARGRYDDHDDDHHRQPEPPLTDTAPKRASSSHSPPPVRRRCRRPAGARPGRWLPSSNGGPPAGALAASSDKQRARREPPARGDQQKGVLLLRHPRRLSAARLEPVPVHSRRLFVRRRQTESVIHRGQEG